MGNGSPDGVSLLQEVLVDGYKERPDVSLILKESSMHSLDLVVLDKVIKLQRL
jgi:hypothetical protein